MRELIAQGAEAKIYKENATVIKDRFAKRYRHPELDLQLRTARTKREATILRKLQGIAPTLIREEKTTLIEEFIPGQLIKQLLDKDPTRAREIGVLLARLHDKNIMHADLTTSNMILAPDGQVRLIDFGLSYVSHRIEDRAVDLHLFRQALESKHVRVFEQAFQEFLEGYKQQATDAAAVLERLAIVEARGRNKQAY